MRRHRRLALEGALPYKQGDRVRVPNPGGRGMVLASVLAPAEAGRKPRFAWVRIEEGEYSGNNERVSQELIEPVPSGQIAGRPPS